MDEIEHFFKRLYLKLKCCCRKKSVTNNNDLTTIINDSERDVENIEGDGCKISLLFEHDTDNYRRKISEINNHDLEGNIDEIEGNGTYTSGFFATNRTEENFIRNNTCPKLEIPSPYVPEYIPSYDYKIRFEIREWLSVFSIEMYGRHLVTIICFSFGWGCIGSAFATILQLRMKYEKECSNTYFNLTFMATDITKSFESILDDYKFLPIFLIVGYIGFVADRWRDWLANCHRLQGRIHSFGLMCGSAVAKPADIVVRKHLYKIYRYLNCIHALTLQSVSIELKEMQIENEFIDVLNLLTEEEVTRLARMDNKMRDALLCWLGIEAVSFLKHDSVAGKIVAQNLMDTLRNLRGVCAKHHDLFVLDRANSFTICMRYFILVYIFLIIFSYPVTLEIEEGNMCLQPMVLLGILVNTSFLQVTLMLAAILRNPFCTLADPIKVSSLLASTERCIFANMRGAFVEEEGIKEDVVGELSAHTDTTKSCLTGTMRLNQAQNSDTVEILSSSRKYHSRRRKSIDPRKAREI